MNAGKILRKSFKTLAWTVMALALLPAALLTLVYAPWSQERIRVFAVEMMNRNGMALQLDSLRLHFPLDIELAGLKLDMEGQSIRASRLEADVKLMPLLAGRAEIGDARLDKGFFSIGAPDSAMYMTIAGDEIILRDASVALATMDINLDDGFIRGGRVDMLLNPDTTAADTAASKPTEMKIGVHRLALDDFAYTMRMLPTIDSLGASIPQATATNINIDLLKQTIGLRSFTGGGLDVAYIAPDSATVAATPVVNAAAPDSAAAAPWTIEIDTIGFSGSRALYTTRGVKPAPGLDFTYISVDSLDLAVSRFYNQAATLRVPLRVSGTERCGVKLATEGTLNISDEGLALDEFTLTTPRGTDLRFSFLMGMGDLVADPSTALRLDLNGPLAAGDALDMFPAFSPYLMALPPGAPFHARVLAGGTSGDLRVTDMSVAVGNTARLTARGRVMNAFNPDRLAGNLVLSGALIDMNRFKDVLFDKSTAAQFNFPKTTFNGNIDMAAGHVEGKLEARTNEGRLSLDADWHSRREDYVVDLVADRFPAGAFMPLLGIGDVSATLSATGHGYDPFSKSTALDADLSVSQAVYGGYDYKGIDASVKLADGHADVTATSSNPNARFDLAAAGNLDGDTYDWTADLNGEYIDLRALGLSAEEATVKADLTADASITPRDKEIGAKVVLKSLTYSTKLSTINIADVTARLNANDSTTNMSLANGDLYTFVSSESPLDSIMARFTDLDTVINDEMASRTIDVERIQRALPPFTLDLTAGPRNAITDMMADSHTGFDNLHVMASNDSSLAIQARLLDLHTQSMRLDTIAFDLSQYADKLAFTASVENRPGTFDEWAHVRADGFLAENKLGMRVAQRNIAGKEGYNVGLNLALADSTVTFYVDPTDPTIAYMPWTVNEDNFIRWSFAHKHLDANLHMHSDKSSLAIFTNHKEGDDDHQEALTVNISDIYIADWIKLNPFAPPMDGTLSADINIGRQGRDISGEGTITLADFSYDRRRVGTIGSDIKVSTDLRGRVRAAADMTIDGRKTVTLAGALNDSTTGSPLAMDLSLISFPLEAANPFLGPQTASLRGTLNGSMDVSGTASAPRLDGWLQFDSAAVRVTMIGTDYKFNNVRIPVDSNIVRFSDFSITGVNDKPLRVNGTVDIRDFANPGVNLSLTASGMQICDSKRASKGADIYGKGFINLNSTIKGNMNFMQINAALTVLSGTNITYVMPNAVNEISGYANEDMVKFVNFADSAAVNRADSVTESSLAMLLAATLTVQTGSTINVDLSSNGRNRVSLQPDGTVDFTMQPFGTPRLTGRLNIPKGFVRYTPPLLSEKLFNFKPESYVAFNGDLMNPTLNVKAVDVIKANVTQSGQNSRLVNFDVGLSVTGTLENMNVAFDLSTEDDITVANELRAMSAEQRANQAMNMLLYNVYSGPGTRGDAKLSGNAVYSFLSSQLNNWAANTIKGVDLTFGIDQYDRTIGGAKSQTTSYSYQVSKSLFNDRFKIVVGGNYSTDANTDENFSQNLIKDISFEYFLNNAQTMYVRLFRHTGYESILEGEITRTGVGFVYKKKLASLRNIFGRRKRKAPAAPADNDARQPQTAIKDEK